MCSDHFEDTMFTHPSDRDKSKMKKEGFPTLMLHLADTDRRNMLEVNRDKQWWQQNLPLEQSPNSVESVAKSCVAVSEDMAVLNCSSASIMTLDDDDGTEVSMIQYTKSIHVLIH